MDVTTLKTAHALRFLAIDAATNMKRILLNANINAKKY